MTLEEAIKRNPFNPNIGNESAYCRYLRYNVKGWYNLDSKEVFKRWQKVRNGMESRITGRVEEWWKQVCIEHNCKYYIHEDYPKCSYCTCPDNCIIVNDKEGDKDAEELTK